MQQRSPRLAQQLIAGGIQESAMKHLNDVSLNESDEMERDKEY